MWEISGKIFVRNQWEITVGNLWQKCEKWLLDNVGNPWEIVNVPWENQWENIYPRGFLHRNNSVGNPWIRALTHGISHGFYLEGSRDQVRSQYSYCYSIEEDPRTYDEAMQSRDAAFWKEAVDYEISSFMENNTWVLSNLPP
ncbi:hypothetical protein Tco_0852519, partial [Tanacetum coccineum]